MPAISRSSETPDAPVALPATAFSMFESCAALSLAALDLIGSEFGAFGEIAGLVFAALAQERFHTALAQTIKLVERAQDDAAAGAIFSDAGGFEDAVEQFAAVDLDNVVAAQPQRIQRIGDHHQQFRVRRRRIGAHRIGIELREFAEAAGAGLFVAPDRTRLIAAERLREI